MTKTKKLKNNVSVPADTTLYNKIKSEIYKTYPKHSAYRSGLLVKKYKEEFKKKYGKNKKPYFGKKQNKKGLSRWFNEEWKNQRGQIGYKYKSDIYRPTIRISKNTPITHDELTKKQIRKARTQKAKKGRVKNFKNITKKGGYRKPKRKNGLLIFKDFPDFTPNLTPREMFEMGSFGGTYWRPIYSSITKKNYKNVHKKYPKTWWKNIPESYLSNTSCVININKYKVRVGTSLKFWESKGWIKPQHPYGWVQWYCDFYMGKRGEDDERQIKRWKSLAGPNGRFRRFLITQILKKHGKYNDELISPKIRQVLQHWGYKLTKKDFNYDVKRRNK
jgi:hypothetical protein